MDLLDQYKQMHLEAGQSSKSVPVADAYGREYSNMTAWVIRLSGGRIRNAKQASYALLSIAVIVGVISFILMIKQLGFLPASPGKVFYPSPVNTP